MDSRQIRLADRALFREVGEEAVILDVEAEQYYGLDPVASAIVGMLARSSTFVPLAVLQDELVQTYDASAEQMWADLLVLVDRLLALELIEVATPSGQPLPESSPLRTPSTRSSTVSSSEKFRS